MFTSFKKTNPSLIWIADYKFFIIIGILAALLLITRQFAFLVSTLFIIFYPLFLLLWRLPRFLFKQRSLVPAFAVLNAIISFCRSFKLKFIATAVFLLGLLFAIRFSDRYVMFVSMLAIFGVVVLSYVRMALFVMRPSSIFQIYARVIKAAPNRVLQSLGDAETRNLP